MVTMTFIRIDVRGGKEYAYEVESYWDRRIKSPRQRRRYLGVVVDRKNNVFEKKRVYKPERLILDFGDTFVLDNFFKGEGFSSFLEGVFGSDVGFVKVLSYYRLCYPSAMRYAKTWFDGNYVSVKFSGVDLSSQRISDFLKVLGKEELQRKFFSAYLQNFSKNREGVIIDATSLPNQIHIPLSAWGRSGEEIDKQIRFLIVVERKTEEPLFFRYYEGNIVDVSTLRNTIVELKKFGIKETYVYIDAGYFSEENIKELYKEKMNFLTRLPSIRCLYKELIDAEVKDLENPKNFVRYGKRALFIKQKTVHLFGKKIYTHIILDPERKAREIKKMMIQTDDEKEKHDKKEIFYKFKTKGIMILVSSFPLNKKEVVPTYYLRQTAEKIFGYTKNDLEILPLRVHTKETLKGLLFLQFMTLIAYIKLKKKLGNKHTVEELLQTTRNLKCKIYDKELIIGEMTQQQKQLTEKLKIIVPKNMGI